MDSSLYRCSLPDCGGGPDVVWSGSGEGTKISATEDVVIWVANDVLFRSLAHGSAAPEALIPGEQLRAVSPEAFRMENSSSVTVVNATADSGMIYAASREMQKCSMGECVYEIARWPAKGGQRETLWNSAAAVADLFVANGELVWAAAVEPRQYPEFELASCRAEACAETKRHLGFLVTGSPISVVADSEHIYWVDHDVDSTASSGRVRRAALLPPAL
jgi:hypothetical protein